MERRRWGILGTAGIARTRMIPALRASSISEVGAIASRDLAKAESFASEFDIPKAYGSYEKLLADPTIDIIYIPLPNHLHVEWIRRSIEAGKHVLCEKPLALRVEDVEQLITLRDQSELLIGEAYAMLHQVRLQSLHEHLKHGTFGTPLSAHGCFYLHNTDAQDIRNRYREGGGALWDLGVYPITVGRWMFSEEPSEVCCSMELDPAFGVDYLTTGILRFPSGAQMSFACGMRQPAYHALTIHTQSHRIEVPRPFFSDTRGQMIYEVFDRHATGSVKTYGFEPIDQYTLECEHFAQASAGAHAFIGSLEQTLANTRVLSALFKAAQSGSFERV